MSADSLKDATVEYIAGAAELPFAPMITALYRQEVLDARRMESEDKLILGERLFRWACTITLEGIRIQNPSATEPDCQRMLRERIALGKKMETL